MASAVFLAVGDSVWELLAIGFIVLVPTVPVTYLAWNFLGGRRTRRGQEIESGRSAATPFAVISVVGSAIAVAAVLTLLLVIAVRAIAA
jgi:hypothetical protein